SPRYDVDPKPGAFRVESDEGPWSPALRGATAPTAGPPPPAAPVEGRGETAAPPPAAAAEARGESDARDFKALMDHFQKEAGRTRQGAVPIAIAFPAIGPSVFLAAELTPETQSPALDIQYRKTGGRRLLAPSSFSLQC